MTDGEDEEIESDYSDDNWKFHDRGHEGDDEDVLFIDDIEGLREEIEYHLQHNHDHNHDD